MGQSNQILKMLEEKALMQKANYDWKSLDVS